LGVKGARAGQKILPDPDKVLCCPGMQPGLTNTKSGEVWRFFETGEANPCQLLKPACNFAIMFGVFVNILRKLSLDKISFIQSYDQ